MGTEIEAKFIVPGPDARAKIRGLDRLAGYALGPGRTISVRDSYRDTESRALLAAGYACRDRDEDGTLVRTLKSVTRAPGGGVHRREETEATAERLRELAGERPMVVLFTLAQDRFAREVRDGARLVATASLDDVSLVMGSGSRQWSELEIELAPAGTEADLARMVPWVRETLGLHPSGTSKFERALQALRDAEASAAPHAAETTRPRSGQDPSVILDGPAGAVVDLPAAVSGMGYTARLRRRMVDDVVFYDTHDGAFLRNGFSLSWSRSSGMWRLREDGRLQAEEAGPRGTVPREGPIGAVLGTVPAEHPGIPLLEGSLVQLDYALAGVGADPLRIRLREWTFRSPLVPTPPGTLHRVSVSGPAATRTYFSGLLQERLGFRPAREPLLEKGLSVLGIAAPGSSLPKELRVGPGDSVGQACLKVFRGEAWRMRMNAPGAVRDLDPEFVHDLRVATRRARSACRLFASCMASEELASLREELRWLAGLLGAVRDLDVLSSRLDAQLARSAAAPGFSGLLREEIGRRRRRALADLVPALDSGRFTALLQRLESAGEGTGQPGGPSEQPAAVLARRRIDKGFRKLAPWVDRPADGLSDVELHRVRILFKRLRYACEFFRPLLGAEGGALIDSFVAYQDCLGLHQDAATAIRLLGEIMPELPPEARTDELLLSMGSLLQVQRDVQQAQRQAFARRWESAPELLAGRKAVGPPRRAVRPPRGSSAP